MKNLFLTFLLLQIAAFLLNSCDDKMHSSEVGLTLIPPGTVTNQVNLDIRGGVKNQSGTEKNYNVSFYWNKETKETLLYSTDINLKPWSVECVKYMLPTLNRIGNHTIILVVDDGKKKYRVKKHIRILDSSIRSTQKIEGAFVGFYHWSEQEGKMWNPIIKKLTDDQWKEVVCSMNKLDMNIIVVQESFRNQEYVGKHKIEEEGYKGKAFYPSTLYEERMPITAADPIEAVLEQADEKGMNVFMGVGMYAWFDYTKGSLEWHKSVAKELWDRYGHHPSFYGFYVSEEGMGSLDCFEKDAKMKKVRQKEVLYFFEKFKDFCRTLAPDKPVMFAPNGWGIGEAVEIYPKLLKNVDIICPFAFARMPENDLSGIEAVTLLQNLCNDANSHLWLDLEAFLFDERENYLVPRPMHEIKNDLLLFDTFEKIICYQFPGVFNDPEMSVRIGEESTISLFKDYQNYLDSLKRD